MDDHHVVLRRERDHALEEGQVDDLRGGVARKRQHHRARLRRRALDGIAQVVEKVVAPRDRHAHDRAARDHHGIAVDRVRRIRDQHAVFRREDREHQVADALLRPDGDDRLGFGIERNVVAPAVPVGDGEAELVQSARHRVPVVARLVDGAVQMREDLGRRRLIRVAHAHVDHVLARAPRGVLQLDDLGQHVRRQARNAEELTRRGHVGFPRPHGRENARPVKARLVDGFAGRAAD